MTPVGWIWHRWVAWRGAPPPTRWGAECPGGTPVPTDERCAALDCDSVPLTDLAEGESGTITCLAEPASSRTRKLTALGVLPGATLELVQRFPTYVFRIGFAEIAVDEDLARRVRVRRE